MTWDSRAPMPESRTSRLEFADGIRGLAALYIVLYHALLAVLISGHGMGLHPLVHGYTAWMQFGNFGVAVFIVLSGFCLTVPVAASSRREIAGGIRGFLTRRARRILPPYYAGLALSALMVLLLPALATPRPHSWHSFALPVWDLEVILSHLFLVHNLSPEWALKINPSLWTVGTEVQLYLLFCLVLVPVWRRFGMLAALGAGFAVGLVPFLLVSKPSALPSPWYPGLFAIGMAAALIALGEGRLESSLRKRIPWGGTATVFCLLIALVAALGLENTRGSLSYSNLLVGGALAALLVYGSGCVRGDIPGPMPGLLRFLQSRPLAFLGAISYSLYVIHEPVLRAMHFYLHGAGSSPIQAYLTLLLVGVPVCLGAAYLFHCAVERRSQPRPATTPEPKRKPEFALRMPVID